MLLANRYSKNPLLVPDPNVAWEAKAVFNPAAIDLDGRIHLLYRAMSADNTSVIGYISSKDGEVFDERLSTPAYAPHADFELKKFQGSNSGCEDPRVSVIDGQVCMCYTAYDGVHPPAVAVTHISTADFLAKRFEAWSLPVIASTHGIDDKDACLLPEKINGKYLLFHRTHNHIVADWSSDLNFENKESYQNIHIIAPREGLWDGIKVGISAPPIRTKDGWLLLYHGVSFTGYRVGALLLDLDDPTKVIARLTDPILEPEADYEKRGQIGDVVFPCGAVVRDGKLFIYYGGADSSVNLATLELDALLAALAECKIMAK